MPVHDEDARALHDIATYGWHAVHVHDGVPSAFTYSVGIQAAGHPELVIFGLPSATMHAVLWDLYRDIQGGRRFDPGEHDDVVKDYPIATRRVHASHHVPHLGWAMWHRRHLGAPGTLDALQVFWTDADGRFPWESACHPGVKHVQPRLDLPG